MSKDLESVKQASSNKLLSKKGVSGVGTGKKYVNGLPTDEDAILVFVQKKQSKNTVRAQGVDDDLVPSEIDGIQTDVVEVGEIQLQKGFRTKERPIKPGYSISHGNVTAGTIGGLFYDRDGDVVALSNFHVLADDGKARPGDIIYQPGTADAKGTITFKGWTKPVHNLPYIGTLKSFHPLRTDVVAVQDSAIAKIHPELVSGGYVDLVYPELNASIEGFGSIGVGEPVYKCGRTTGFTNGRVIARNAEFQIPYGFGTVKFKDIILTNAMSQGGDSGSLGINKRMEAFGLLFAGSAKVTLYNDIAPIVQYYGLRPMNEPEENNEKWQEYNWRKATTDGIIKFEEGHVTFRDNAHHHCYIETSAKGKTHFAAYLNKGTDQGTSWGIGLTLVFPKTSIKINLRFRSGYGVYINDHKDLSIGKVKLRTKYLVEFTKEDDAWIGTVQPEGGRKMRVLEVPVSMVGDKPQIVRVGKTGDNHGPKDYGMSRQKSGVVGNCHMLDFRMS